MVRGNRLSLLDVPFDWVERFGGVVASVGYRPAPQANGTDLVEDCYAGLVWVAAHAAEPQRPAGELHIWAGGFHGFDSLVASATVSAAARASKIDWVGRQLAAAGGTPA